MSTDANQHDTILDEAYTAVNGPRQVDYGPPQENLALIASLWSSYCQTPITPQDVCMMMVLLKAARARDTGPTRDTLIDIAGYAYLGELCGPRPEPG